MTINTEVIYRAAAAFGVDAFNNRSEFPGPMIDLIHFRHHHHATRTGGEEMLLA